METKCSRGGALEEKPSSQFISWVNHKVMSSGDECRAAYFRHNCLVCPNPCLFDDATAKHTGCAENNVLRIYSKSQRCSPRFRLLPPLLSHGILLAVSGQESMLS